jgi:uncharacterized protein YndB with AHSA1/START domain
LPALTRERSLDAAPAAVWDVVRDPDRLPAWWPGVQRVEAVSADGWSSVFLSPNGRTLRADFSRVAFEPPRRVAWRQELEGSPFERILSESFTELRLAPAAGGGTQLTLVLRNRPRGLARLGHFQLQAALRAQAEAALHGLEALF